ncbi:MAG TPA: TPM domain-containing protein [Chryseolinea sp.]|nr:TPM domain-containing protein [Chryseolinea sp.]
MIRLTILLLTLGSFVYGQDSTFVQETCNKINQLKNKDDIEGQANIVYEQSLAYIPTIIANGSKDKKGQDVYKFQYKLRRELKRTCPGFILNQTPIKTQRVLDFEDTFSKSEIDSLKNLMVTIGNEKSIYIFLVTIDDYFPDNSIEEFTNRIRDSWGHGNYVEKGSVLIAISVTKRQMRISTGDKSMKYLSDEECEEANKKMRPFFKKEDYFNGVIEGLNSLKGAM